MDKIICIGKNYLDHAKELGDAIPTQPVVFFKPPSCISNTPGQIEIPSGKGEVHHELEIVIELSQAWRVGLGLDLTLRDVQKELKESGHPWERSKAFPGSAVLGSWFSMSEFKNYLTTPFLLKVNGQVRQKGVGKDMRLSPEELVSMVKKDFLICEGDLLFTGTPAGVAALKDGDVVEFGFEGQKLNEFVVRTVS